MRVSDKPLSRDGLGDRVLESVLTCFGIGVAACGAVFSVVNRASSGLDIFSRFGPTGSGIALALIVVGRFGRRLARGMALRYALSTGRVAGRYRGWRNSR